MVPRFGSFIPFLPLRDIVVFPHMIVPLFVGRGTKSIKALEEVMRDDQQILLGDAEGCGRRRSRP